MLNRITTIPRHWILWSALCILSAGCAHSEPSSVDTLPPDAAQTLADATDVTLYSLEPFGPDTLGTGLYRFKVLGKTELAGAEAKKAVAAFQHALSKSTNHGESMCAFDPHHALRVSVNGHIYDYLLCYECGELVAYKDGNGIAALEAHGGTPAALNTLLTNAHVPLSFVYNPETKDLPYSEKSIPATMFPNAPAKAASAQCFSFVSAETPIATVVQKCGKPDRETGRQGLHNFVWKLQDKSIVIVSTPYLDRIYNAAYIDAAGKTFPLLHAKDGLNR